MRFSFLFYEPIASLDELASRMRTLACARVRGGSSCRPSIPLPYPIEAVADCSSGIRLPVVSLLSGWSYSHEGLCLSEPGCRRPRAGRRSGWADYVGRPRRSGRRWSSGADAGAPHRRTGCVVANGRIAEALAGLPVRRGGGALVRAGAGEPPPGRLQSHRRRGGRWSMPGRLARDGVHARHLPHEHRGTSVDRRRSALHAPQARHVHLCETNGGPFGAAGWISAGCCRRWTSPVTIAGSRSRSIARLGWEEAARSSAAFLARIGYGDFRRRRGDHARQPNSRSVAGAPVVARATGSATACWPRPAPWRSSRTSTARGSSRTRRSCSRDLGMDVRDLGAMTVAFMLAYGLFEVPWGRLGDRFGARDLLVAGRAGRVADDGRRWRRSCCCRGRDSVQLGFLLALRFLFGMFQAGTFPLLSRLMADWMPTTERGSAQGFIWMCSRAGGVLAPMVMVWLFHRLGNWRIAAGPRGGPGGALVPGRLALAPQPARADAPGQRGRAVADRRGRGPRARPRARAAPPGGRCSARRTSGPCGDVRLPRLQRQLLPVPVRQLPAGLPPPRQGHGQVADGRPVRLRRGGLHRRAACCPT